MVVSIVIVLPINFQGNLHSNFTEFQSSTIRNLGDRYVDANSLHNDVNYLCAML